jgi:Flp pilus assembly protein TadG
MWTRFLQRNRTGGRNGNNIIEFAFMLPWYLFLFVGAVDMGLYSYALISVQNAARVSAIYCAASSTTCTTNTPVCPYALGALADLPNIPSTLTTCSASPVTVTVTYPGSGTPDGQPDVQVTVAYVLPALAGIPGILPGQYTASRTVSMKLQS